MHTDSTAAALETVPAPTRDSAAPGPPQPDTRSGPSDPPGPAANADFELMQRTVAELDDAATERRRATGAYREALAALEAAAEDKAEAEAVEADARANLLGLCVDLVREHAEPGRVLYVVREDYVRVASTARSPQASG